MKTNGEPSASERAEPSVAGPATSVYVGIFFVSVAVLVFQVVLTRIFAIMMWYHFAYLIISLALLGFGASGSLLTLLGVGEKAEEFTRKILSRASLLFGLAIMGSFFSITLLEIDTFAIWTSPVNLLVLVAIFLILSVPFLAGGLTIGTCLSRYADHVGKLYFVDLIGAAVGAVSCALLLENVGLTSTVMASAALAGVGAVAFSMQAGRLVQASSAAALLLSIVLALGFGGGALWVPSMDWEIAFAPNKKAAKGFHSDRALPSAVARVDISLPRRMQLAMGGDFGRVDRKPTRGRVVLQDGTAPTFLFKDAADLERYPQLDDTQAASAYVAHTATGLENPAVMVIGVGGGIDVMIALFHGASSITAVEINQAMIRMVTDEYNDFIGNLFSDPRVTIINEDGRSHLMRSERTYDIIQLSGVDTFTALSTGVYTLSESYLYTLEAIEQMYAKLNPGGIINFSRFLVEAMPRETIRLANTAFVALERIGIDDPASQIAIFQGYGWASTMIKKGRFTAAEIDALGAFGRVEEFRGLVFDPLATAVPSVTAQSADPERTKALFFELLRGSPTERRALIASYPYDLRSATDDKPFFFNYFKWANSFSIDRDYADTFFSEYLPLFPVGHMVLMSSLIIIVALALGFILLPMRLLGKHAIDTTLKLKTFAYFSALGMGFMFIEVCMMQKFILLLGHPTYSMSVVLGSILAFSGLGALASSRIRTPDRRVALSLLGLILVLTLVNALSLDGLLMSLQSSPLSLRIAATVGMLAPTAFVLGMPFPLGVRMLEYHAPQLIPWGWAINGFLSVLSSILATVIAMGLGFTWVLLGAGAVYALGLLLAPVVPAQPVLAEGS